MEGRNCEGGNQSSGECNLKLHLNDQLIHKEDSFQMWRRKRKKMNFITENDRVAFLEAATSRFSNHEKRGHE